MCNNIENGLNCIMLFTKAVLGALKNRVLSKKTLKSLVDKTFSKIFDKAGKIEIGPKFSRAVLEPFLIIGNTLATFRLFGKISNLNDVSIKHKNY